MFRSLSIVLCLVFACSGLAAQIVDFLPFKRGSNIPTVVDSIHIENAHLDIDTTITGLRFEGWDPLVSVDEVATSKHFVRYDGEQIHLQNFGELSSVDIAIVDVLGRTVYSSRGVTRSDGSYNVYFATMQTSPLFVLVSTDNVRFSTQLLSSKHIDTRPVQVPIPDTFKLSVYSTGYITASHRFVYSGQSHSEVAIPMTGANFLRDVEFLRVNAYADSLLCYSYDQDDRRDTSLMAIDIDNVNFRPGVGSSYNTAFQFYYILIADNHNYFYGHVLLSLDSIDLSRMNVSIRLDYRPVEIGYSTNEIRQVHATGSPILTWEGDNSFTLNFDPIIDHIWWDYTYSSGNTRSSYTKNCRIDPVKSGSTLSIRVDLKQ